MPLRAAKTETTKAIESSPALQAKLGQFPAPSDNPTQSENKLVQKPEDLTPVENETDAEKQERESRQQQPIVNDTKKREVVKSFKRESPYDRTKREALEKSQEAETWKTKAEEAEGAKKELETQLTEARQKLEDASTNKDRKEAQSEVQQLKTQISDLTEASKKREQSLERQLEYLDLQNSPSFKREFVAPVIEAYGEINEMVGDNPEAQQTLAAALNANASYLSVEGAEAAHYRDVRDQLLSKLTQDMPTFRQGQFTSQITDFLRKVKKQSDALKNWEPTKRQIEEQGQLRQREAQVQHRKFWGDLYSETSSEVEAQIPKNEELETVIKDNKIPFDIDADELIAKGCMTDANIPERDITRILNQGRLYSRAVAYVKAQEILIQKKDKLIAKLQGSDPGNLGDRGSHEEQTRQTGMSLQDKIRQHSPQRR